MNNSYNSFFSILLMVLNSCQGSFLFGYMLSVYNILQDYIAAKFSWDSQETSLYNGIITALVPVGALIGSLISSNTANRYGLRISFISFDLISLIGIGFTMVFNLSCLMIGRFIIGVCVGVNSSLVPLYINQISPREIYGQLGTYSLLILDVGQFVAFLFGLGVPAPSSDSLPHYWRLVFGFPAVTCVLRIIIFLTVYKFDTPMVLVRQSRPNDARLVLAKIYKPENVESNLADIEQKIMLAPSNTYKDMFKGNQKRKTLIAMAIQFFQQFSGINAVGFFSKKIFEENGNSKDEDNEFKAKMFTLALAIVHILSVFFISKLIDRTGKKLLIIAGDSLCIVALVMLGVFAMDNNVYGVLVFVLIHMFAFSVSLGPVCWIICAELVPAKGMSLAVAVNWICCALIGAGFLKFIEYVQLYGAFFFFTGWSLLGLWFFFKYLEEDGNKKKALLAVDDKSTEGNSEERLIGTNCS